MFLSLNVNATEHPLNKTSNLKQQITDIKQEKRESLSKIKKGAIIDLKQQIKDRVQAKREQIKENVAAKREEFKTRLQTIKDQRKKILVERIDAKLNSVNIKHTERFTLVLSNLQMLLNKISRSAEDTDVSTAQAAIDSAKSLVESQAAKTYTITISAESALRSDVGTVTSQLRQDLSATHKAVVDAKQAVQKLKRNNVIMKKDATSSANL